MPSFKQRILLDLSAEFSCLPDVLTHAERTELFAQVVDAIAFGAPTNHVPRVRHEALPSYNRATQADVDTLQAHYNSLYVQVVGMLKYHHVDQSLDDDTLLGVESVSPTGYATIFRIKQATEYPDTPKE